MAEAGACPGLCTQLGDSNKSEDALSSRLVALPPPGQVRTAARGGAASFGVAELRRCSALQRGDLPVDSALTAQRFDRLRDLLTCGNGGPNRCVGNPLRSPA